MVFVVNSAKPAPLRWRINEILTMTRQQHITNRNNACLLVNNLRGQKLSQASQWEYAMARWKKIYDESKILNEAQK